MKNLLFVAAAAAAVALASCESATVKTEFNTEEDSLAYNFGRYQGEGLKEALPMQFNVDSAHIDAFIKGLKEGAFDKDDKDRDAYLQGVQIGQQIQQMTKGLSNEVYEGDTTKTVNIGNIVAGILAAIKPEAGKADSVCRAEAQEAQGKFMDYMNKLQEKKMEKQYGDQKKKNEAYLETNKKAEGVVTLPSGVQYKVLAEGKGDLPTDSTVVKCHYEGKLIDGTVFDSSYERSEPFEVNMAAPRVIKGWAEVLKLMPAGSKWEVTIPADQAYGAQDMGQIKPFSTLIFTIEVLK